MLSKISKRNWGDTTDYGLPISSAITAALKVLLSQKHLYQQVTVDTTFSVVIANNKVKARNVAEPVAKVIAPGILESVLKEVHMRVSKYWDIQHPRFIPEGPIDRNVTRFSLPTINTFCDHCDQSWPFNPLFDRVTVVDGPPQIQFLYLSYQCQNCKTSDVHYLIHRDGIKLSLCGRHPIEVLPIPKTLPKAAGKYYSDAQIAHHAGQTLAGLFLLRTFIEQFWHTTDAVKQLLTHDPRATGDAQGSAYQETLPDDFKSRFPSLRDTYGKLSAALHAADASAELFERSRESITEHFEARKLFKIK